MSISGRARETSRLGELAQGVGTGGRAENLRPQRLERSDRSEGTITLFYHGSCSRCHHFHRHVAFDVWVDHSEHTRFHCERCHHPMCGLGRTDTQNSLASQDSIIVKDGVIDSALATVPCSNNSEPPLSVPPNASSHFPPGLDQLSAIPEQPALGQSRPILATSALASIDSTSVLPIEPRPILTGPSAVEIVPDHQDLNRLTREPKLRLTFISDWFCNVLGRLARRVGNAPHEVKFLGLQLHYQFTSDHLRENQPSSSVTALAPIDELPTFTTAQASTQDNIRVLGARALSAAPVEERVGSLSYGAHNTQQAHTFDELITYPPTALKKERLRRERREKTMRARALQKICDCTEACHCKGEGIEPSFSDGSRHIYDGNTARSGTSRSFQWFPGYPLDDLVRRSSMSNESNPLQAGARPDPLTHFGGFHLPRWRPSNTTNASTMGDSSGGRRQASAAVSNTSSVSLHPSRPVIPGRSFSASLLPFSPPSHGTDFGTRDVLRSLQFLHHARAVAAGSGSLPWQHSGNLPSMSRYDWAVEPDENSIEAQPPSPRAISTDTACNSTAPENQPQEDGLVSASSSSSLVHERPRESELILPEQHSSLLLDGTLPETVAEPSSLSSHDPTTHAIRHHSQ